MKINWIAKKTINTSEVNNLLQENIKSNQFANYGSNVKLLECRIRELLLIDNSKSVIAIVNGSSALHVLSKAIAIKNNKNINWATQSFTFPSSAQNSLNKSKIIDIDEDGGINLDKINNTVDGIIVTNIFGNIVDIDKYELWAKKKNKFLIFDNAATPFTFYKDKSCCNYGIGSIISFHHTKPIGFGEGGAIIVDKEYEDTIRKLCNFGINLTDEYWNKDGNNYKMSEISAVYILQYLNDNFNKIIKKHSMLYSYFKSKIDILKLPYSLFPSFHDNDKITPSCFCLLFDNYSEKIEHYLKIKNIFCRKYYYPLKKTPITVSIYNKILCIPCNLDMNKEHIDYIISKINEIII